MITPTFHFKILEQFVEIFDRQGRTFVDQLKSKAKSGESFDVFPMVTLCALDVICGTLTDLLKIFMYYQGYCLS